MVIYYLMKFLNNIEDIYVNPSYKFSGTTNLSL